MNIIRFIKNWTLPIAMAMGVILYFVYVNIPFLEPTKPFVEHAVAVLQPLLIFLMLFLTFCKVDVSELKPCKWHVVLLLIQSLSFIFLAGILYIFPDMRSRILIEGAMLCLICPTATAAAVVTGKLGGSAAHLTSYTILINLVTAFLVPLVVPVIHPQDGVGFISSFLMILGKVFPLLLCPFILAVLLRYLSPKLHAFIGKYHGLSFYLWAVALTLAIAVTVKSIVHSDVSIWYQVGLAFISCIACFLQFYIWDTLFLPLLPLSLPVSTAYGIMYSILISFTLNVRKRKNKNNGCTGVKSDAAVYCNCVFISKYSFMPYCPLSPFEEFPVEHSLLGRIGWHAAGVSRH